jgi:hypothetical protein
MLAVVARHARVAIVPERWRDHRRFSGTIVVDLTTTPTVSAIRAPREYAERSEGTMPAPRGSSKHCEAVEGHGSNLQEFMALVDAITADGVVDEHERVLLFVCRGRVEASYAPLPGQASQQDGMFRLIGAMAQAGQVTPWVMRLEREQAEDEARLIAA